VQEIFTPVNDLIVTRPLFDPKSILERKIVYQLFEPVSNPEDAQAAVDLLFTEFDDLSAILNSDERDWRFMGVTAGPHLYVLSILRALMHSVEWNKPKVGHIIIKDWIRLQSYLKRNMGSLNVEQFRVLFLTGQGRFICEEVIGTGSIDRVTVPLRTVVQKCVEHNASSVILIHNHPGNDPNPSLVDALFTEQLANALNMIDVFIADHVIVTQFGLTSMKQRDLLTWSGDRV